MLFYKTNLLLFQFVSKLDYKKHRQDSMKSYRHPENITQLRLKPEQILSPFFFLDVSA